MRASSRIATAYQHHTFHVFNGLCPSLSYSFNMCMTMLTCAQIHKSLKWVVTFSFRAPWLLIFVCFFGNKWWSTEKLFKVKYCANCCTFKTYVKTTLCDQSWPSSLICFTRILVLYLFLFASTCLNGAAFNVMYQR